MNQNRGSKTLKTASTSSAKPVPATGTELSFKNSSNKSTAEASPTPSPTPADATDGSGIILKEIPYETVADVNSPHGVTSSSAFSISPSTDGDFKGPSQKSGPTDVAKIPPNASTISSYTRQVASATNESKRASTSTVFGELKQASGKGGAGPTTDTLTKSAFQKSWDQQVLLYKKKYSRAFHRDSYKTIEKASVLINQGEEKEACDLLSQSKGTTLKELILNVFTNTNANPILINFAAALAIKQLKEQINNLPGEDYKSTQGEKLKGILHTLEQNFASITKSSALVPADASKSAADAIASNPIVKAQLINAISTYAKDLVEAVNNNTDPLLISFNYEDMLNPAVPDVEASQGLTDVGEYRAGVVPDSITQDGADSPIDATATKPPSPGGGKIR